MSIPHQCDYTESQIQSSIYLDSIATNPQFQLILHRKPMEMLSTQNANRIKSLYKMVNIGYIGSPFHAIVHAIVVTVCRRDVWSSRCTRTELRRAKRKMSKMCMKSLASNSFVVVLLLSLSKFIRFGLHVQCAMCIVQWIAYLNAVQIHATKPIEVETIFGVIWMRAVTFLA